MVSGLAVIDKSVQNVVYIAISHPLTSFSVISFAKTMKIELVGLVLFLVLGTIMRARAQDIDWDDPRIKQLQEHKEEFQTWFMEGFVGRKPQKRSVITCALCETVGTVLIRWIKNGMSLEQLNVNVIQLCKNLNVVQDEQICEMIVPLYCDPMYFMITSHPWITIFDVCGIVLGGDLLPGCFYMNNSMTDWVINVDYAERPPVIEHPVVPDNVPTVKVVHLTDVHPDLHYDEGSLADCGRPLCCRADPRDDTSNTSALAGHWGDFLCDFPMKSTRHLFLDAARRNQDADFVIMTGDLVHHQIWNTTVQDNMRHYVGFINALMEAFPNTQIYPAIGNHEPHPCNMFPPTEVWDQYDLSWMYSFHADLYRSRLTPQAHATFRRNGYYTMLHRPGFRIVGLNTNFCYTNNFWIIYDAVDPEDQLQWFSDVMLAAERADEKVWIVGHIPPGSYDCWSKWSTQFLRVINRYQNIILAQFYGHTHYDEIRVFFDDSKNPPVPSGSLYIGASVTPYTDLNPGYKVFYADGVRENATWQVVDHETWVYDLATANAVGANVEPLFYKEYSAKEAYNMTGFRPADLWDFVQRMAVDDDLFRLYYRYWYKDSNHDQENEDCPSTGDVSECKFDFLCEIVNTDYTNKHCDLLRVLAANRMAEEM